MSTIIYKRYITTPIFTGKPSVDTWDMLIIPRIVKPCKEIIERVEDEEEWTEEIVAFYQFVHDTHPDIFGNRELEDAVWVNTWETAFKADGGDEQIEILEWLVKHRGVSNYYRVGATDGFENIEIFATALGINVIDPHHDITDEFGIPDIYSHIVYLRGDILGENLAGDGLIMDLNGIEVVKIEKIDE